MSFWTEIALLALLMIGVPVLQIIKGRRFQNKIKNGGKIHRPTTYIKSTIFLWGLAILAGLIWVSTGRDWSSFNIIETPGFTYQEGIIISLVLSGVFIFWNYFVTKDQTKHETLKKQLGEATILLPKGEKEFSLFTFLSLTAGITEEFLFRGIIITLLSQWLDIVSASILALIPFAVSHAYQGLSGIFRTGLIGGLLTLVYLATGSLIPAMILHAAFDIGAGVLSYRIHKSRAV